MDLHYNRVGDSLAITFALGWWVGLKSVAHVATGAAQTAIPLFVGFLIVTAALAGLVAFRARGFLDGKN